VVPGRPERAEQGESDGRIRGIAQNGRDVALGRRFAAERRILSFKSGNDIVHGVGPRVLFMPLEAPGAEKIAA
jgi:hypothetical protein